MFLLITISNGHLLPLFTVLLHKEQYVKDTGRACLLAGLTHWNIICLLRSYTKTKKRAFVQDPPFEITSWFLGNTTPSSIWRVLRWVLPCTDSFQHCRQHPLSIQPVGLVGPTSDVEGCLRCCCLSLLVAHFRRFLRSLSFVVTPSFRLVLIIQCVFSAKKENPCLRDSPFEITFRWCCCESFSWFHRSADPSAL